MLASYQVPMRCSALPPPLLVRFGAAAALFQDYPSSWLATLLAAALAGNLGQGLAWLWAGAAPELLAMFGATLYRLLAWRKPREVEDV